MSSNDLSNRQSRPLPVTAAAAPGETFEQELTVPAAAVDRMGHVNNVAVLGWLEDAAWAHSEALGLDWAAYQRIGVACMVRRHVIDYRQQAHAGDALTVRTWIEDNSGRATMTRGYSVTRADGAVIVTAQTLWACVRLDTGKPTRMPPEFLAAYAPCVPDGPDEPRAG